MIQSGAGCSAAIDSREAGREAAREALAKARITQADWGLVFVTFPHIGRFADILIEVCDVLGTDNIAGCSCVGLLTGTGEVEGEPAVAVLASRSDTMSALSILVEPGLDDGLSVGARLSPSVSGHTGARKLLAIMPDPFLNHPEFLLSGIETELGDIDIVGASASLHPNMAETYQFGGRKSVTGGVSSVLFSGDFDYRVGVAQGCRPVGRPLEVTECHGNLIFELEGRSAFEVMREQIPDILLSRPAELPRLVYVAFPPDPAEKEIVQGEYLVRNLMGLNPDTGIVAVAQNVEEGQTLQFTVRNPELAREDIKLMLERLGDVGGDGGGFALYFNCCGRGGGLYGHEGIDTAYITAALGDVPLIGVFGNAEFAPLRGMNRVFTYTGVLTLIT